MAPGSTPEVRPIRAEDLASATVSTARAFYDDPVMGFFQPNLMRQQRQLTGVFGGLIRDAVDHGETWVSVADGRARGVAAWLRPGGYPRSLRRDLRMAPRALPPFLPPSRRLLPGLRLVVAIERGHPRTDHWYLALLAVDPLLQGRGLGTALLQPVLDKADADGLPAYLETQKPENLGWYARAGFEVTGEFSFPPCPPVWGLTRPPRPRI